MHKSPLPYSLHHQVSVKNNKLITILFLSDVFVPIIISIKKNKLIIISFLSDVFVPIILSLPSEELTGRSSRTKKLSVDPPPSSRHLK